MYQLLVPLQNFNAVETTGEDGNTFHTSVLVPSDPQKFFADLQKSSENGVRFTFSDWPETTILSIVPGGTARGFGHFENPAILSMYLDKDALENLRDTINAVLSIL